MADYDIAQRQALPYLFPVLPVSGIAGNAQREAADGGVVCRLGDASCASAHASSVSRRAIGDGAMLHRSLCRLQRDYGNQFVGQVLRQASDGHGDGGLDAVERSIETARGGGQGMDHSIRRQMESSFGADFSAVRIHHDARADGLSQSLSARAFTTGRDVFFRQGEYSPGTSSGRELLAHELTHVVQQNGSGVQRKMTVSQPGDPHEVEADRMAQQVMQQEHTQSVDRQAISRQEDEEKPVAAKYAADSVQRQPEAAKPQDEEEKKKLHTKLDPGALSPLSRSMAHMQPPRA